jgi:hypothetical protein
MYLVSGGVNVVKRGVRLVVPFRLMDEDKPVMPMFRGLACHHQKIGRKATQKGCDIDMLA